MCAIIGPSGAGKSTLLDMLSSRKTTGIMAGRVLVNQRPRSPSFNRQSAYVLQDDVHIAELTVAETIMYSVWTRLPEGTSGEAMNERVRVLLDVMGLTQVRDSMVGSKLVKGISGGQKKRLSIAESIAALPPLVFLDGMIPCSD
jgi:ATP-binding cassette, subfamily G (WHITE), member 2